MGRRKHSKIDNLEPAVKETVDEMIKTGAYYREIVEYIQSHGVSISLAAVGKYAKNLMSNAGCPAAQSGELPGGSWRKPTVIRIWT